MTLFFHEIKRGKLPLIIWSGAISFLLLVCIVIYPEMEEQMKEMSDMFADMGALSDAFSMDQLTFSSFTGYFSIECGEMLGIGGAIFAAITAIGALSKEEGDKTAEFLLTHPVSRTRVAASKLASVTAFITVLNIAVAAVSMLAMAAIGVTVEWGPMLLIFFAYYILQLEIGCICFGLSALLRRRSVGVGLGLAMALYFANLVANITESTDFLKYVTPFAYTEGSHIIENCNLEWKYVAIGAVAAAVCVVLGFLKYEKKDIH